MRSQEFIYWHTPSGTQTRKDRYRDRRHFFLLALPPLLAFGFDLSDESVVLLLLLFCCSSVDDEDNNSGDDDMCFPPRNHIVAHSLLCS